MNWTATHKWEKFQESGKNRRSETTVFIRQKNENAASSFIAATSGIVQKKLKKQKYFNNPEGLQNPQGFCLDKHGFDSQVISRKEYPGKYHTGSPLILYNAECKSGGVQKLSGAVFCTPSTAEKLTVLYQINGELL